MKKIIIFAALVFISQSIFSQDSTAVKHPFGIFLEFRGYIDEKLCLKYKLTADDCVITQFQIGSSVFRNSLDKPYYATDGEQNNYTFLIGYQRTIGIFDEVNLTLQTDVEREWSRSIRTEGVYKFDEISRMQIFQYNVDVEERTINHRFKFGMGAEHYLTDQISLEIQKRVYYEITNRHATDAQLPPNDFKSNEFFFESSFLVITYYF
ncbi:MAG: hypothetical protein HYV29_02940 [Ignavibacteriales bacterium]|nr:hypothetical protein [Ignavibacteriales bacterium]